MTVRKSKAIVAVGLMLSLSTPGGADAQLLPAGPAPYIGQAVDGLVKGRVVVDSFLGLIGSLSGWKDLTQAGIESAMGHQLTLGDDGKYSDYVGEMRDGSHFKVTYYPARARLNATIALTVSAPKPEGIFHHCPIPFDYVRQKFLSLGFVEGGVLTDIGGVLALQYSRGDMTFSVDAVGASTGSKGEEPELCFSTLLTS